MISSSKGTCLTRRNCGVSWTRYVKDGSHVFLTTDSYQVRNLSRHLFGSNVWNTDGTVIHVGKQARVQQACPGFGVAILDQLSLTNCDVLITSASGFSQVASYLRGSSKKLFSFRGGNIRLKSDRLLPVLSLTFPC